MIPPNQLPTLPGIPPAEVPDPAPPASDPPPPPPVEVDPRQVQIPTIPRPESR